MLEWPCYQGAAYLFESYGATVRPVPVDEHGLDTARLPDGTISLAYVAPSHQYPLGSTLALERRIRLLEWAWEVGAYIVEDDYDSDFRYSGSPLTALAGLDACGAVIYLGTFSKSIGGKFTAGLYGVLPAELVEPAQIAKALLDNGQPWLEQAVLADFIANGSYANHLRRIRQLYRQQRDCLVAALTTISARCGSAGWKAACTLSGICRRSCLMRRRCKRWHCRPGSGFTRWTVALPQISINPATAKKPYYWAIHP
ncbi:MAG: PLP-dependent aminotransferase family protein [Gammaproteobacteria bacterium]